MPNNGNWSDGIGGAVIGGALTGIGMITEKKEMKKHLTKKKN